MTNKPQPVESFRVGNLDFAVWENQGEDLRPFYSFSIKRNYMDSNGQWQESGEIRMLPQQSADLKLGVDKMYEFWRLGLKRQKKPYQSDPTEPPQQTQNSGKPPSPAIQASSDNHSEQTEMVTVATTEKPDGFSSKLAQPGKSKRSR